MNPNKAPNSTNTATNGCPQCGGMGIHRANEGLAYCRTCDAGPRLARAEAKAPAAYTARQRRARRPAHTEWFFDRWGGLWATCGANHPNAEAFGPCFTARKATPQDLVRLRLLRQGCFPTQSPHEAGTEQGRTWKGLDGWTYLR